MRKHFFLTGLFITIGCLTIIVFAQTDEPAKDSVAEVWKGHENSITSISYSASGKWLASSSLDGTVRIWNTEKSSNTRVLRSHKGDVYSVSISKDERVVASAGFDGRVVISNLSDGEMVKTFSDFEGWCQAVVFSPDSKRFAVSTTDGKISIWEIESGKNLQTFDAKREHYTLAWSSDGKYLAAGRGYISIWDVLTGQQVKTLKGHNSSVYSVTFSPDSKLLASASHDGTAKIWNINSGESIQTVEPRGFRRIWKDRVITDPYSVPITAVAFSADGKYLATGSSGRIINLWDVSTGKSIRTMQGHTMTVTDLKFSPDGKYLASSSLDRTIRLWNLKEKRD